MLDNHISTYQIWNTWYQFLNFSYLGIEVATKNVITVSFERFETFSRTEFPDFECFVITGTN